MPRAMSIRFWLGSSFLALAAFLGLAGPGQGQRPASSITEVHRTKILHQARDVDRLINIDLKRHKIEPLPISDDATFVRRVYLDVVGRIPTAKEAVRFLESEDPKKRSVLIDALLDSPGSTSHLVNWWADLLRIKTRLRNGLSGEPYLHWLKESLVENKPYDVMVRELLSAEGPAHKKGSGSTGYYLRDRGMPLENMAATSRIFLGTRIECAQCHNHPYDSWTQKQFYEMAAFTAGMQFRDNKAESPQSVRERLNYAESTGTPSSDAEMGGYGMSTENMSSPSSPSQGQTFRSALRILQPLTFGLSGSGIGMIRLPENYAYDDAKPREVVKAQALFGPKAVLKFDTPNEKRRKRKKRREKQRPRNRHIDSRSSLADWMTSPDNPRFTIVIANRMWKFHLGRGLIEPVDDLRDNTVASNQALMNYLERLMVEHEYDLRQFRRVLLNTNTYQRMTSSAEPDPGDVVHFEGPLLRRMTAEQIWDSVLTLAIPDLDASLRSPEVRAERIYARYEELQNLPIDDLKRQAVVRAERTRNPEAYRESLRTMAQTRRQKRRAEPLARQKKMNELQRTLRRARRAKNKDEVTRFRREIATMRSRAKRRRETASRLGLVRASDLVSPAPPGHFLRQFGQSDREQIDGAHRDATIPQALNLLNGFVEQRILGSKYSTMLIALNEQAGLEEKINTAYLGILNRPPTSSESTMWADDLASKGRAGVQDLVWTLVNTHEFLFIQ